MWSWEQIRCISSFTTDNIDFNVSNRSNKPTELFGFTISSPHATITSGNVSRGLFSTPLSDCFLKPRSSFSKRIWQRFRITVCCSALASFFLHIWRTCFRGKVSVTATFLSAGAGIPSSSVSIIFRRGWLGHNNYRTKTTECRRNVETLSTLFPSVVYFKTSVKSYPCE